MTVGTVTKPTLEKGKKASISSVSFTSRELAELKKIQKKLGTKTRSETIRKVVEAYTKNLMN